MSKITAEEAKKALHRLSSIAYMNLEDTLLLDEYIYQNTKNLTPTLDKVFCNDNPCQYCNLNKRELKMVQSELNDAYLMLQNRDNKIKELERGLKYYETK